MVASYQKHSSIIIANYYWLLIVIMATTLSDAQTSNLEWKLGSTGKARWSVSCDFPGDYYDTINEILQEEACEELCVADKRCAHFTFNPRIAVCYLKKFQQPLVYEKNSELKYSSNICGFVIDRVYDAKLVDKTIKSFEWRIGTGKGMKYKWGTGCLFIPESDIDIIEIGNSASCAVSCFFNKLCTHFNYFKNRCYLKTIFDGTSEASAYNDLGATCGFIVERKLTKNWKSSNKGRINWGVKCDFPGGFELEVTQMSLFENNLNCGDKCLANKRCTHFVSHTPSLFQVNCFLKQFQGEKGAVEIYKEDTPICGFIVRQQGYTSSSIHKKPNTEVMINTTPKSRNFAVSVLSAAKSNSENVSPKKDQQFTPLWSDEFSVIDMTKNQNWKHSIGVSKTGFQYYTNHTENSFIRDGLLNIKPTLTSDRFGDEFVEKGYLDLVEEGCDPKSSKCISYAKTSGDVINPIASAKVTTKNSFNFTFGTVEIRAKMPKGDWISAVISLEPVRNVFGKDKISGTIELFRVNGNTHMSCLGRAYNRQVVSSGLISGSIDATANFGDASNIYKLNEGVDFSTDFHVFSTEWSPEGFKFFVDGEFVGKVPERELKMTDESNSKQNSPWIPGSRMVAFNEPFIISVRVDVGGQNFPDINCTYLPKRKPWSSSNPNPMRQFWNDIEHWFPTWKAAKGENVLQIDYIRVYSQSEQKLAV